MQLFFQSITEIISDSLKSKQYLVVIMTKLILEKSVKIFFFASIAHKSSKSVCFWSTQEWLTVVINQFNQCITLNYVVLWLQVLLFRLSNLLLITVQERLQYKYCIFQGVCVICLLWKPDTLESLIVFIWI